MWTSVTAVVLLISLRLVKCSTEPEFMAMAIGHLDNGVYPYALHDEDLSKCISKEAFKKHENNSKPWTYWDSVRCLIEYSSERLEEKNSITKYKHSNDESSSTEELLNKYCKRWTPKIDTCFEASTSLLNDCNEKEPDKGSRSLFFGAAYMNYICQNKTETLENLVRGSGSQVSLGCFLELEDDIFACVKTKADRNRTTDFCTNFQITKGCLEEKYETVSQQICNSTNYSDSKLFVFSLLQDIKMELCKETDTMHKKMMEHTASKQTDRSQRELKGQKSKTGANGSVPSVPTSFKIWTLISTISIVSYANLQIIMS